MIRPSNIKTLVAALAVVFMACHVKGQHAPQFGQYMFNGLVINPAYAGSKGALYTTLLTRAQWTGFTGAPRTANLSIHTTSRNLVNNFGAIALHDRIGVYQRTSLQGIYAYRIPFEKATLSFGLQGGFSSMQVAFDRLAKEEDFDPSFEENPNLLIPQFGAGAFFSHDHFYLGISAPELLRYQSVRYQQFFGDINKFRNFFLTGGFLVPIGRDVKLKPSFLVKQLAGSPMQTDFNLNLIYKDKLWLGASYRTKDAIVGLAEFQVMEQMRIGYAFGWSISDLRNYNNGSHEIVLSYRFGYNIKAPGLLYF